jgi:hypothetical protein
VYADVSRRRKWTKLRAPLVPPFQLTLDVSLPLTSESLRDRIDSLRDKMDDRLERLDARIDALAESLASAKVWALVLYVALAGGLLGTLARGFGWL